MKKIMSVLSQKMHNLSIPSQKLFPSTSNKLVCEKYDCSKCSNCNKLLDCKKYVYGFFIGSSVGFFFGYNYNKNIYYM